MWKWHLQLLYFFECKCWWYQNAKMISRFKIIFCSVIGMPKEKYDPPDPRRMYTIMSSEEAANGKKSYWAELEISGEWNCFYRFQCVSGESFIRSI